MKRPLLAVSLVLLAVALLAVAAWAQTSPGHDLSWHVLSGGGREGMTSGTHTVHGTLGQLAIGPAAAAGGGHAVSSGYWYGIGRQAPYNIYVPLVFKYH